MWLVKVETRSLSVSRLNTTDFLVRFSDNASYL